MLKNFVRRERIKKGLTIMQLAEKSKIPSIVVLLIENGDLQPTSELQIMLAMALKTRPERLFPKVWLV